MASSSKKRSIQDIFSSDADVPQSSDVEPPKKKRASRFIAAEMAESSPKETSTNDSGDIQKLLASTIKQIEERKKQTQVLLAKQTSSTAQQQGLVQQNFSVTPQLPLLQTPFLQRNTSVHPLAYSREKHLALGMAMGGSALDKAVKAAEVCTCITYYNYNCAYT